MVRLGFGQRTAVLVAAALAVAAATPTRAAVISSTPTLPLLGVPYVTASGGGCFPTGICVSGGRFTFTLPSSPTFDATGQDIKSDALFSATLTNLSHVSIGTIQLSGTAEQEVLGRTSATELGSWTTDVISLSLSGPVLGHTLTVTLDTTPGHESTGETSIEQIGNHQFKIDSFFDVFVELSFDTLPPLQTMQGPVHAEAVPEPSSIAAIAMALIVMPALYRRRGATCPKIRII
jgi:hypothetical protein